MSFCSNCGAQLEQGTVFCPYCGANQGSPVEQQPQAMNYEPVYQQPVYDASYYQQPVETPTAVTGPAKIMSIISMICGLVSLVSCYGGFVPGIAALVLANIASKKAPGVPNTMTKVGKITGIIGIAISALCLIGYIVLVTLSATAGVTSTYPYY